MAAKTGEPFFAAMAWILTGLVALGFGTVQLLAPDTASPFSPALAAHAVVFFGWYILLIVQPRLVAKRNIALHMHLGQVSILLALAIAILGYLTVQTAYHRPDWSIAGMDAAGSTIFPVTDIINFSIAYWLALANRRNAAAHKRLMLMSGLLMIDPAVARLVLVSGAPPPLILLIELALFAAFFIYDWRKLGKPHWATWLGFGLFAAAMVAKFTLANTPGWARFVGMMFG